MLLYLLQTFKELLFRTLSGTLFKIGLQNYKLFRYLQTFFAFSEKKFFTFRKPPLFLGFSCFIHSFDKRTSKSECKITSLFHTKNKSQAFFELFFHTIVYKNKQLHPTYHVCVVPLYCYQGKRLQFNIKKSSIDCTI